MIKTRRIEACKALEKEGEGGREGGVAASPPAVAAAAAAVETAAEAAVMAAEAWCKHRNRGRMSGRAPGSASSRRCRAREAANGRCPSSVPILSSSTSSRPPSP